ncbi:MAG TPA: hypothetical protein VGR37_24290, partial [Longimicrobiaceae bacterium]|nr:hypothetical protein [Longimicrobiaceae bacterium]
MKLGRSAVGGGRAHRAAAGPGAVPAAILALAALCLPGRLEAQGDIRGTIHAPPGETVQGAMVIACHVVDARCSDRSPQSKAVRVDTRGASASFVIRGLAPGEYMVIGLADRNQNGREDEGDWAGHHAKGDGTPAWVTPPATGVTVRLAVDGAVVAAPARPPS